MARLGMRHAGEKRDAYRSLVIPLGFGKISLLVSEFLLVKWVKVDRNVVHLNAKALLAQRFKYFSSSGFSFFCP